MKIVAVRAVDMPISAFCTEFWCEPFRDDGISQKKQGNMVGLCRFGSVVRDGSAIRAGSVRAGSAVCVGSCRFGSCRFGSGGSGSVRGHPAFGAGQKTSVENQSHIKKNTAATKVTLGITKNRQS